MKLLLGAKRYLEELELKKKKEMEPEDHEEENNFTVAEQKTLEMKLLVSVVLHPLDYAKNLIMMGYEPLPPYQSYWFGKPYYLYPNVLKYVRHIYSVDGVLGCFRGIVCKSSALVVQNTLITYFDKKYPAPQIGDSLQSKLKRNIVVKCICTLASHPLQMMAVRCMAQFVGLFKGFWAKLLGEVALVTASVVIVHSIHRMIKSNSDSDNSEKSMVFVSTVVNFACVSYFYPYNVVSTTMSVNGAGLSIGQPPMSPIFANTHHCYTYLSYMNQLKRGSNLFYRWVPTVSRSDDILKLRSA
ncbi:hypothetical protein M8J76_016627 [Diaphorina citri]|nr:hypothetical protein M8J76_016627 [Diaphorina citri]